MDFYNLYILVVYFLVSLHIHTIWCVGFFIEFSSIQLKMVPLTLATVNKGRVYKTRIMKVACIT